jgi:hypothetical protein
MIPDDDLDQDWASYDRSLEAASIKIEYHLAEMRRIINEETLVDRLMRWLEAWLEKWFPWL